MVGLVVIALAIPLTVALAGIRQELRGGAAPSTGSILINNGATTTDSETVILTLTAPTQQASLFKSPLKVPQAYAIEDCFDSDDTDAVSGEFNYSTKGYVDDFGDRRWDVCFDENTLVEFYCKQAPGQNRPSRGATHHPCPDGCEDGKCVDINAQDPDPTPTPTPAAINPVRWTTPQVSLRADDFYIIANGQKFLADTGDLQIQSDPGNLFYTTLEAGETGIDFEEGSIIAGTSGTNLLNFFGLFGGFSSSSNFYPQTSGGTYIIE